jgi:hypothetical protein
MRVSAVASLLTVWVLVATVSAQEKPGQKPAPPAPAAEAPKEPGKLVGVLMGGSVISQQAETFSQADPFLGFLVGYRSRNDKFNIRFQGIFDVQAQKATAPEEDGDENAGAGDPIDPANFQPFLASRKTFDVDVHVWYDFLISGNLRIGPYFAGGVSTFIDPNELAGDQVTTTEEATASGERKELDLTRAIANNDVDHYFEAGAVGSFFFADTSKLFMQAMMLYGRYESLSGLVEEGVTPNRFVAKLRVFPSGLDISATSNATGFSPMFGVELNAGKGPDQIKFFTGVAVSINRFKSREPAAPQK